MEIEQDLPQVLRIVPKDIHVMVEHKVSGLTKLRDAMALCEINCNGSPEQTELTEFFHAYYKYLNQLLKDIEENGIG